MVPARPWRPVLHHLGIRPIDVLEEKGFKYLFISNSDNLGARPSRTLAQHFENTGAPFMIEVANVLQLIARAGISCGTRRPAA